MTEDLIDRIAEQSDAQAAGTSIRDLERLRDRCLVGVMHALADQDHASGAVLRQYETSLATE